ncbi:MAG: hypothetical protein WBP29_00905 [Candidatus Zixiibacteriota bacterium]
MAEEKQLDPADDRYRYIGFEVFGSKTDPFWRNEDERKSYVAGLRQQIGSIYRNSVVYSNVVSKTDRIFIIIASAMMIIAPFLTWMKATTLYGKVGFMGLLGVFNMSGFWFYVQKTGGWVIPATVYLLAALAFVSLILGVMVLLTLFRKAPSEDVYLQKLKSVLRLNAIPFAVFLMIILLSVIGQRIPFGQYLGVQEVDSRYSIVTFIQLSSVGLWLSVFGFILNFNKSKEI